jgi:hypothetical protein
LRVADDLDFVPHHGPVPIGPSGEYHLNTLGPGSTYDMVVSLDGQDLTVPLTCARPLRPRDSRPAASDPVRTARTWRGKAGQEDVSTLPA